MNKHVSKSEFKSRALELMREVQQTGVSLIVTDRGQPVLEVRPVRREKRDPREFLRGSLLHYERPTDPVGEGDWEVLSETK